MVIWTEKRHRNLLVLAGEDSPFAPRTDIAAKLPGGIVRPRVLGRGDGVNRKDRAGVTSSGSRE
jgi:hypothetical protein